MFIKWTRRIILFVLLGTVVNALVAWGCVIAASGRSLMGGANAGDYEWGDYQHFGCSGDWERHNLQGMRIAGHDDQITQSAGLPFMSLTSWSIVRTLDNSTSGKDARRLIHGHGVLLANPFVQSGQTPVSTATPVAVRSRDLLMLDYLPCQPLWPGFIVDIEIYACLLYGLTLAPFDFRRWRRRRKNLCLKCGYALAGNVTGVCPECGKAK